MHRRTLDSNNKIFLETFEGEESVIRNSISKKDRQQNGQKKRAVIRNSKSKKDREDNGQKKRVKTSNG